MAKEKEKYAPMANYAIRNTRTIILSYLSFYPARSLRTNYRKRLFYVVTLLYRHNVFHLSARNQGSLSIQAKSFSI